MPSFDADTLKNFGAKLLVAAGASEAEAETVAKYCVNANLVGHDSHGIILILSYVQRIKVGHIVPGASWDIVQESPTTPVIDGNWGFGFVVTERAMAYTIEKAKTSNVAAATVFRQSHIGRLATYPLMAIEEGMIGLITAAMIAAFMSTHDGYLLCWSTVITQDIIAPLFKQRLDNPTRIKITRILIVLIGLYILYWGLFYTGEEDIWDYMAVTGAIYFTGAFSLLFGGLYWHRASSTGAVLALLPRQIGWGHAHELLLTAQPIDAERAVAIGLVNALAPASELLDRAFEHADAIAASLADRPLDEWIAAAEQAREAPQ